MSDHPLLKTKKGGGGARGCQFMLGTVKREKEEVKIKQKFGGGYCDKSPKGVDQTRSDQCPIRKKNRHTES